MDDPTHNHQTHVVIVGGGFGGLQVAKRLRKSPVRVTLIDRRNFHLFQPLLYQVATGGLSPANIATPLRSLLRKQKNCEVLLGEVTDVDVANQRVILKDGELPYDKLILAAGATHSYFGQDEWASLAPGLKTVEDATEIRRRIFVAFEAAEREPDPEIRAAWLTFVIVGGGATGVELAGALAEIAHRTLAHDFRHINPSDAKIVLVEAAPHVLGHYPDKLCERVAGKIRSLDIELRTKTKVVDIQPESVKLQSESAASDSVVEELPTRTILWAAGVQANSLGQKLASAVEIECDRAGRIPVQPDLTLPQHPEIFVIGDIASCPGKNEKPLPGMAPVAIQQGRFVARQIDAQVRGRTPTDSFEYRDQGSMAAIGRGVAVAKMGAREFCGFFAWLIWLFIHLIQIAQFQNRLLVLIQWMWNYMTFNRSARLITEGRQSEPLPQQMAAPSHITHSGTDQPHETPDDEMAV